MVRRERLYILINALSNFRCKITGIELEFTVTTFNCNSVLFYVSFLCKIYNVHVNDFLRNKENVLSLFTFIRAHKDLLWEFPRTVAMGFRGGTGINIFIARDRTHAWTL